MKKTKPTLSARTAALVRSTRKLPRKVRDKIFRRAHLPPFVENFA